MRRAFLLCCGLSALTFALFALAPVVAQDPKKDEPKKDASPPPPKTFTAKSEPFQVDLAVKGYLESERMHELMLKPDSWSMFQVVRALQHGTKVNKGDQLVWLDMTKIDEAIRDTEAAQLQADIAHRLAVADLTYFEKLYPLDVAAAELAKKHSDEDLRHYLEKDKPLALEQAEQNIKQSRHGLEYTEEELKQLEKMYKAKDLTEDTEELILKRQRRAVESAKFFLKYAELNHERQIQTDLPRREKSMTEAHERAAIAHEKAMLTLPMQRTQKKLALESATRERQKSAERLAKLRKDREMMVVVAPLSGVVYYGRCQKGQFSGASGVEQMLQPAGNLAPNQIFMTIVDPARLFIRASIEEKDRHLVKEGEIGKTTVAAFPDAKFASTVKTVGDVPAAGGGFDATLSIEQGEGYANLRPGMAASTKLTVYKQEKALVVPDSAVFKEEDDEDQRFVYLSLKKDGKWTSEKRAVTVGKKSGGKIEIVKGLGAGDQILQAKPAEEDKK